MSRERLRVLFEPGAGESLGYPDDTEIQLDLDQDQQANLRSGLRAVLDRRGEAPRLVLDLP